MENVPKESKNDEKESSSDKRNDLNKIPKEINKFLSSSSSSSSMPVEANYGFLPLPSSATAPSYFYNGNYTSNPYINHLSSGYANHHHYNSNYLPWYNQQKRNPTAYDPTTIPMPTVISKMAEDKMKPAFKSIEMILETFNSINMILDSTYSALYGSFRTITGVADHLIFIRNHMSELAIFSRLSNLLLNFLKWLLKLLGLSNTKIAEILQNNGDNNEEIWNDVLKSSNKNIINDSNVNNKSSLWPVLVFFSIVMGTPYIVWRLLGSSIDSIPKTNQPDWTLKNGRHFIGIGLQNYQAKNSNELNFRKGQMMFVKPESLQPDCKWLVACTIDNPNQIGVIPLNYVKLYMQ